MAVCRPYSCLVAGAARVLLCIWPGCRGTAFAARHRAMLKAGDLVLLADSAASAAKRHWVVLSAAMAAVALASCTSSPARQPTSRPRHHTLAAGAPRHTRPPFFTLNDVVAATAKCPPRSPRSDRCYRIKVTGNTLGLGTIRSGSWFDVEAPLGSPACGQPTQYFEQINTAAGTLTVRAHGRRLCLGIVGTVKRTYTVVRATGSMRHLRGHGTITLTTLASGATEAWTRPAP